jgi:hypothetical protein
MTDAAAAALAVGAAGGQQRCCCDAGHDVISVHKHVLRGLLAFLQYSPAHHSINT